MDNPVHIEVVYALPEQQWLCALRLSSGTTALEAVHLSQVAQHLPNQSLEGCAFGVFGRLIKPEHYCVQDGDRLELYRPLRVDPKEIRKQRAVRNPILKKRPVGPQAV